jgi:PAS domain S-box-containing protein
MAQRALASSIPPGLAGLERAQRILLWIHSRAPRGFRPIVHLGIAAAATAAAGLVQYLVLPPPSTTRFVFFYAAVAVVAWLGGRGPGLLTVLLSALAANWLYLPSDRPLSLTGVEVRATVLFVVSATLVAILCGLFRNTLLEAHRTSFRLTQQASLLEQALERARESEERFRTLAENSPDLIVRFDRDLRHLYANAAAGRAAGIAPDHFVGRTSVELGMPSRLLSLWESHLRRAFDTGGPQAMEFQLERPEGTTFYESRIVPELGPRGDILSVLVTGREVTERKHTEEALRESERSFRSLADAMPQLVWAARPDGTVDYYNRRSAEFPGIERHPDGSWSWAPVVHPEDLGPTIAAWQRAVASGEEYQVEHRLRLANGTFRWHLSRGVPVRNGRGVIVKWYGTSTDIQEQKRAQEVLQEADRRKNEFLGVLSHELRNPLAPIRNSLFIVSRASPGTDQHRRALATIERQVGQLTRLVDDLLDVTRIARGKVHLNREKVDLRVLARQAFEDHADGFAKNGLDLRLETADEELFVFADPARLGQVIGNLLQNAAKFTPRGSQVTLSVRPAGERHVEVSVVDTGQGIPPDLLARLFQPFVQAEGSTGRSAGGLGLGLALVKGLVELHGGTVAAHSAGPGMGARFVVTIPRERRAEPRLALVTETPIPSSPRRVLIIEDNPDAAATLKEALEMEGHVVALAYTGDEGIQTARAFKPRAVICDIGLPGMSGFEVAKAIRSDPDLGSITLIALSGYALADDIDRAKAAGFDLHLAKPPDLVALGRSILESHG